MVLAGVLAIDFDGVLYRLYLGILVVYPVLFLFVLIIFGILAGKTRDLRNPSTLSAMLLLAGFILLPLLERPVSKVIKNTTSWNRISAFVSPVYRAKDLFEFTITAHGNGSKEQFTLDRGYTNISINEDYRSGPSLYYRLNPDRSIRLGDTYETLSEETLVRAFRENQLEPLSSTESLCAFAGILEALSVVRSQADFRQHFAEIEDAKLNLVPHENAVYRVIFAIIGLVAILLSMIFCRRELPHEEDASAG